MGRPLKYGHILNQLDEDTLFTPATIAEFALKADLLSKNIASWHARERLRIALGRYAKARNFPGDGDGNVVLRGQAPTPGWFGWRWKAEMNYYQFGEVR